MRRFAALLWVGVFALGPGGEARAADAAWPMFRYDPARTARSPYEGTAGFGVSWTFAVPGGTESSISIGSDGSVYFGAYDNNFYALNSNGTLDWKFLTGNAVQSSPAIDSGGALYFGGIDNLVYALNPGGGLRWSFETGDPVFSSPAVHGGVVYVGSMDNAVYGISASDPSDFWT